MSSSPAVEPSSPSTTPSSPALRSETIQFHTSTPSYIGRKHHNQPLNVILPATAPATPPNYTDSAITPPPRSPGTAVATPASGDSTFHPPDGTSSDKSSETAVSSVRPTSTALSRKESYKAQRQHYRREKKRAASALLHSIEDPSVVVLADWLKVRGSLKSWTKLWCVLKPGLLLLYKTPKVKSSHWVGTVLLTSCQVIERPSKKDGFCFKLYHPLEQSIWAPRGPHNETIGAVVQPLPTAHLIFRAPSQAAGHCWLDGLELALRCSNAMLRCSRSRPEHSVAAQTPATQTNLSHEELEKHFNEHGLKSDPSSCSSPLMSISDYSPRRTTLDRKLTSSDRKVASLDRKVTSSERKDTLHDRKVASLDRKANSRPKRTSKWSQFIESLETMRDHDSSGTESDSKDNKKEGFLDFLLKRDGQGTSSMKNTPGPKFPKPTTKSLASSPMRVDVKRSPILRCFELPKLREKAISPALFEDNFMKFMSQFPKRRSSTPSTKILTQRRISDLRESGVKTDSENDDVFLKTKLPKRPRLVEGSEVICDTPESIIITKTAPSVERFRKYTSSSTDDVDVDYRRTPFRAPIPDKYSLINYEKLPSVAFEASKSERRDERFTSQNVYVAGKVVRTELAGAASDTDSDASRGAIIPRRTMHKVDVRARIEANYVEDPDREVGAAGELVEEVGEENKSLLWFLLKQVRPGMDLSKVVLPTFILEPRSFLDKLADSYYHADILAQAQNQEDPYQRFKLVLRWYLSGLYKKPKGLKKPYNPVLGEIFRCRWKHRDQDCCTYYVSEQVSHHPPVSAFYVSNRMEGYVIEGSLLARSKFYGNSTSAILQGCARVHLLQWGETYITTAPYAHCKGLVIGTLSMELGGKVQIMCEDTGYNAEIEFKLRSFLGGADQTNSISGRIKKGKDLIATLEGYWDGKIDIKDKKTGEETSLLDVAILKEQRLARYLMKLDRQQEFESQKLWIKVSEAIANDDQVAATEEKTIIEEAQRGRARNQVTPWMPRYFHREPDATAPEGVIDQGWRYNHSNTSPWRSEEVLEYEEDFVIQSLGSAPTPLPPPLSVPRVSRQSDSDTHTDTRHRMSNTTTRTLKHTLYSIESSLREQAQAIERLNKNVEAITESQRAIRPQNIGRLPQATHSWDLFGGFVLALVLQALLNWLFYHKD